MATSGKGTGTGGIMSYLIPGLETAGGLGSQFIAPGNPVGASLASSGVSQLLGNNNQAGQSVGGMSGGLGSILGGSAAGLSDDDLTGILGAANPFSGASAGLTDATSGIGEGSSPTLSGLFSGLGGASGLTGLAGGGLGMLGSAQQKNSQVAQPPKIVSAGPGPTPTTVASQPLIKRSGFRGSQSAGMQLMQLLKLLQG